MNFLKCLIFWLSLIFIEGFILLPKIYFGIDTIFEGNPVIIESFEDQWDYQISPHDVPLLSQGGKEHVLPKFSKRQSKHILESKENKVDYSKKIGDSVRKKISCSTCRLGALLLQGEIKKGTPVAGIKIQFVSVCVGLKIENEIVCSGLFDVFSPDLLPALNMTQISVAQMCSLTLGEICGEVENPLHEWDVKLPDVRKPEVKLPELSSESTPTYKVLHLADTHFDPNYIEGSPANCDEPLCCHSYSTMAEDVQVMEPAGKWGSYGKCDSPKILIENMLRHISEEHPDIDYIIWTGDLPPHDIWNQTRESNLYIIKETVNQMLEAFPTVPIFPALGNHESVPAGSFPPPWIKEENRSVSWLYDKLSAHWKKWLPSAVNNTVNHGGFYSVLMRPGFRLISLNMNYCISVSWWLVVNSTDPARELQWLIYELQSAEEKGEKVHIIGHIPPGDSDCIKVWSRNFYKIIERYEDTIVAQFYGHRHSDEFEVFYDTKEYKKPVGIAYIGPSVTTFENYNPGYRIYYVDGDHNETTREVIDHETWIFNLETANMDNLEPEWYRLYSAREAYGLETLRPQEWASLIDRMVTDSSLFTLFYRYYFKDSPVKPPCDDNACRLQILCDLKSGKSHDRHHLCHDLEEQLRS